MAMTTTDDLAIDRSRSGTQAVPTATGAKVKDINGRNRLVIDADVPLHTAALLLHDLQVSGAPVVDADGQLIGVLSQRELLDRLLIPALTAQEPRSIRRWWSRTVAEVCSTPAHCTTPDASIEEAAAEMFRHDVGRLVVVDGSTVVGMITQRDLLRHLVTHQR
jgi:CBS domain-containing protein